MAALPQNFHHERTERPRDNFVAVRIVESNSVDNVAVALQREKFFARIRVPHLHRAVVNFSTFFTRCHRVAGQPCALFASPCRYGRNSQ